MNQRLYFLVTGTVFGIVSLVHLIRIFNHWNLTIGSWDAPMWVSYLGIVLTGSLSVWAFRLTGNGKSELRVGKRKEG